MMRQQNALIIAAVGGLIVWYFWNQQRQARGVAPRREAVPQSWIEQTPSDFPVVGTTARLYDIPT